MIFYSKWFNSFCSYDITRIRVFYGNSNASMYTGISTVQIFPSWSHVYQISTHLRGIFSGLATGFFARPNPGSTYAWTVLAYTVFLQ